MQATGIPPHVAVMHAIRLIPVGECVDRLAVVQSRFVDEMEVRMNTIVDAREIGGEATESLDLLNLFDKEGYKGFDSNWPICPCGTGGPSWRWRWCASSTAVQASHI
jgi:hypothetical protein